MRLRALSFVVQDGSGNKKGPVEGPQRTVRSRGGSIHPGGAPGYDDEKQVGNFVSHVAGSASQKLQDHTLSP